MKVLVTGGAGYIGSVVAKQLLSHGHEVLVLDNFSCGHPGAVPCQCKCLEGDILDRGYLGQVFDQHGIDAVMHLAADSIVETSMKDPGNCFRSNVVGSLNLLQAMLDHCVKRLVFSSSAAVYGNPENMPISEECAKAPVNAYGESKLIFERILDWHGRATGLKYACLRYFNAAGATDRLGEDHRPETHLIPIVLKAAMRNEPVRVFGTDYPTEDGTCVRDYVHVSDIANAHLLALERLDDLSSSAFNLGNGEGYSVKEVIDTAKRITGRDIPVVMCSRRTGDPPALVASSDLARRELGWQPQFPQLESIVETAWKWLKAHPAGYGD